MPFFNRCNFERICCTGNDFFLIFHAKGARKAKDAKNALCNFVPSCLCDSKNFTQSMQRSNGRKEEYHRVAAPQRPPRETKAKNPKKMLCATLCPRVFVIQKLPCCFTSFSSLMIFPAPPSLSMHHNT